MYTIPLNTSDSFDKAWQKFVEKTGYAMKFWKKENRIPRTGTNINNKRKKKEKALRKIAIEKKIAEQLTMY